MRWFEGKKFCLDVARYSIDHVRLFEVSTRGMEVRVWYGIGSRERDAKRRRRINPVFQRD